MDSRSKGFAVFFILIIAISALSLLMVKPAFAQSIPKPSVPEYTLSFVTRPLDIGPSYTINPYTGENETLVPAIHTTTAWVDIRVKNQPFSSYTDANGNSLNLFYNVTLKGHFTKTWSHYPDSSLQDLFNASASDITVISIPLGNWPEIGSNSTLDFRLESLIGHYTYDNFNYFSGYSIESSSGWSNPQTITVYPYSSSPTPTSTSTPSVPEFPSWTILLLLTIIATVGLLVYHKKHIR